MAEPAKSTTSAPATTTTGNTSDKGQPSTGAASQTGQDNSPATPARLSLAERYAPRKTVSDADAKPGYRAYELMREEEGHLKFITSDGNDVYGMSYTYIQGFHLARRWKKGKPRTPEHCREILYIHAAIGTFAAHGRNLTLLQQKLDARQLGSLREFDDRRDTLPETGEPVITHFSLPGQDDSDD